MTNDELDHLEALFRNPPSMGVLAEHGLRLIGELRKYHESHRNEMASILAKSPLEQSAVDALTEAHKPKKGRK